jgi:AcrR family transcriptional regulator
MKKLHFHIDINPELYTKNPDSSILGKKIISNSIELINEIGFELFTFKKLALKTNSTESSIYRYFENKHKLLIYLTSWYWTWMEYKLVFATTNIESPSDRLEKALELLTKPILKDNDFSYVNEAILSEIIFSESIKAYHTKNVDEDNSIGSYSAYKSVVNRVGELILEINPTFKYPHMLISTVIEGAHHQKYFSEHLPTLTNLPEDKEAITNFYKELVFNFL